MGRYDQFEQPSRINPARVLITIVLIVLVVTVGYLLYPDNSEPEIQNNATQREIPLKIPIRKPLDDASEKQQTKINSPPTKQSLLTSPPEPQIRTDLPPLDQSDSAIQQDISNFAPQLSSWFTSDQLIRKFLTIVNDFSQGLRPYKHFRFLNLKQPFLVNKDAEGLAVDPLGYRRYDKLVNAVNQLNINTSLKYYQAYRPLLQQVFAEFGYPRNHNLDDLFKKSIAQILEAPLLEQRIALIKHASRYKFSDKTLESLNLVHKQMIRMGPNNTRILQNKLRQFVQALTKIEDDKF